MSTTSGSSLRQAPCHQLRPSTSFWRSNFNSLMPEFNFQRQVTQVVITSRCMAKDVGIIIGNINMYVRFYICDVSAPRLGVNDLVNNNIELNLRSFNDSYLQQHGHQKLLQYISRHFYIPAILTEANKLNESGILSK